MCCSARLQDQITYAAFRIHMALTEISGLLVAEMYASGPPCVLEWKACTAKNADAELEQHGWVQSPEGYRIPRNAFRKSS